MISVLKKGLYFTLAPWCVPAENIIYDIEATIQQIPSNNAEEISRLIMSNTYQKRIVLSQLKRNEELIVLPADNGTGTFKINTGAYNKNISSLLNKVTYRHICNPKTS